MDHIEPLPTEVEIPEKEVRKISSETSESSLNQTVESSSFVEVQTDPYKNGKKLRKTESK